MMAALESWNCEIRNSGGFWIGGVAKYKPSSHCGLAKCETLVALKRVKSRNAGFSSLLGSWICDLGDPRRFLERWSRENAKLSLLLKSRSRELGDYGPF